MRIQITLIAVSVLITACTQPAAMVENKGNNFFGPHGITKAVANADKPMFSIVKPNTAVAKVEPRGQVVRSSYQEPIHYNNTTVTTTPVSIVATKDLAPITTTKSLGAANNSITPTLSKPPVSWSPVPSGKQTEFIMPAEGQPNKGSKESLVFAGAHGEPVYASADGVVAFASDELKSYGNMVIIKHDNNMNTSYAHLNRMVVAKGTSVRQGQIIGYLGQPEMQFTIRKGTTPVDANWYLSKQVAAK